MTTKERIIAEIDRIPDESLSQLYELVKSFADSKSREDVNGFMTRLLTVQFDGPADLAENHELYASGEKIEEPDIR